MNGPERTAIERRGALIWLIRGFLSLWAFGAGVLGLSFLRAPSSEKRPGERQLRCGSFSTLAVGEARLVRAGVGPVFVVRVSDTQVAAVSAVCTHLRCMLKWDRDKGTIQCPCHDGSFDRTGNVLSGPPKKPLPQYAAEIRADEIIVHT